MDNIFANPYAGLLGPEEDKITQRVNTQGLLGVAGALLEAGGRSRERTSLGQAVSRGLQAYQQSTQSGFENALKSMMVKQKLGDEENLRKAIQSATRPVYTQEQLESAQSNIDPTQLESGMTRSEVLSGVSPVGYKMDREAALSALAKFGGKEGLSAYLTATKPTELTSSWKDFQLAMQNPQYAEFLKSTKGGNTINIGKPGQEFVGKLAKQITDLRDVGMSARSTLPTLDSMSNLLQEGVKTGFGQETMLNLQRVGQAFNPNFELKNVAGQEAFLGFSNEVVLPQVKKLGVNPTDTDLTFIVKGAPTLSKSAAGNQLMIDALKIKFQRDALLQEFATDWQVKNAKLINDDPVTADAKFNQDLVQLTKTHPLYTQAADTLRQRFSSLTGSKPTTVAPLLQQGGFVK